MQPKWAWFERNFNFDFPAEKMPDIIERLRGTPGRIEEMTASLSEGNLDKRETGSSWSIKENIGHLSDLEPLWIGRIQDIVSRQPNMRDADLTNQPTFDADHNTKPLIDLTTDFRSLRNELVQSVVQLDKDQWSASALHPRLKTPMRIVDLCEFIADHDDYHLARIRYLSEILGDGSN